MAPEAFCPSPYKLGPNDSSRFPTESITIKPERSFKIVDAERNHGYLRFQDESLLFVVRFLKRMRGERRGRDRFRRSSGTMQAAIRRCVPDTLPPPRQGILSRSDGGLKERLTDRTGLHGNVNLKMTGCGVAWR